MIDYQDELRPKAKIAIIGEALGLDEEREGRPFAGATGRLLTKWWYDMGLTRADFSLLNAYPKKPAGNKLYLAKDFWDNWQEYHARLMGQLERLPELTLVVPLGATALKMITGNTDILNWRGSILSAQYSGKRTIKTIPSIHPAAVFQVPTLVPRCLRDWALIGQEWQRAEVVLPKRNLIVNVTNLDQAWCLQTASETEALAIDIEANPRTGEIICVAFSPFPDLAWSIPFKSGWQLALIKALCALSTPKIMHPILFDSYWLEKHGVPVINAVWDTLAMHHCVDPAEEHSLAFLGSMFTKEPYWKKEGKDTSTKKWLTAGTEGFMRYNCKDAAVTRELWPILYAQVEAGPGLAFYHKHYGEMLKPCLAMELEGIRVDNAVRVEQQEALKLKQAATLAALEAAAGEPLMAKKSLSLTKLRHYLYTTLELPKRYTKKESENGSRSLSTDEVTIRTFIQRFPDKLAAAGQYLLDFRRAAQLATFYADSRVSADGQFRFSIKFNTEAGRLATAESPTGEGANIQNQDREVREIFLPERDHIFLEVDASQIESRYVFLFTGDPKLVEAANAKPWQFDQHKFVASLAFGVPMEQVSKLERQLGKVTNHGAQRGMTGVRMSDTLLKSGYIISPGECQRKLDDYFKAFPGIQAYFRWVRGQVMEHRKLVNSWGRQWLCSWDRLDDDLYRRAYSFLPQSECADHVNQWGLIPAAGYCAARKKMFGSAPRLVCQVHDSLLFSTPPEEAWKLWLFLKRTLEQERLLLDIHGQSHRLVVPMEMKIGRTWAGDKEFKQPPTKEEFMDEVSKLINRRVEVQ